MTRFMLLTRYRGGGPVMAAWDPADLTAHLQFLWAVNRELAENGELIDVVTLAGPELARWVTVNGAGTPVVTDRPHSEVKEILAEYQMIDVESEARALEIAAMVSSAPGQGGIPIGHTIEVRRVMSPGAAADL